MDIEDLIEYEDDIDVGMFRQLQAEVIRLREWQAQMVNKMADERLPAYREQSMDLLSAIQRAETAESEVERLRDRM